MRIVIAVLKISLLAWAFPALPSDSPDPLQRDVKILRETFERPLQIEFETRGLSKDDAAKAAVTAIDWLISCWRNQQTDSNSQTEETMAVHLGGSTIITYATPCMYGFQDLLGVPTR